MESDFLAIEKRNSTKAKITSLFRFLTAIWYLGAFIPPQLTIPATELRFLIFPAAQSSSRFFSIFFIIYFSFGLVLTTKFEQMDCIVLHFQIKRC